MFSVNKSIIVYWGYACTPEQLNFFNVLELEPKSVLTSFIKEEYSNSKKPKESSYLLCPAMRGLTKNIFYLSLPFNNKINYSLDKVKTSTHPNWWTTEENVLDERLRINLDIALLFFCEESLEMEVLPPYLHNSFSSNFGLMASGVMNISKWFRPINASWILNKGVREIEIKKDEPFMYIKFNTTKKIIFKQFKCNEELISYSSIGTKLIATLQKSDRSMKKRYSLFEKLNINKKIFNIIKNNLV